MARQSNGNYIQPANTAAVSGQTISSTAFNTLITDVGTEITNSLDRGGRSAMTASLPMGNNKITGMADPAASTDGATKNYVDTATGAFFSTGDVKFTLKTAADTGWLLFDDGTFGSGSSGASNRANNDTQPLFNLFYNSTSDANVPILTQGGGATTRAAQGTASAAWAANCRMSLPKTLGRAIAVAGAGSGLTTLALGQNTGANTVALGTSNLPPYTPAGSVTGTAGNGQAFFAPNAGGGTVVIPSATGSGVADGHTLGVSGTLNGTPQGGTSVPVSVMQPTIALNAMVKL